MTNENTLRERALAFRALHIPGRPLVLPNAWNAMSARLAEDAATVRVPVSADVESGYAKDPAGVADTVRAVLAAGAVGINIEDALYEEGSGPLRPLAEQASEAKWGSPRTKSGGASRSPARPPTRRVCRCSSTPGSTPSAHRPSPNSPPWAWPG
ncbi:isocitrate lyase/phosphoenolpyruvate mutase family protein [Streptomyces sp. NPDC050625]|uniref:isocitrate lyase/phosphoenolpyruvate mutase family protein n=1 Tax=Streptomyces sp. NPDC050625 TaxID=3154629 RepID=UPI00344324E5